MVCSCSKFQNSSRYLNKTSTSIAFKLKGLCRGSRFRVILMLSAFITALDVTYK